MKINRGNSTINIVEVTTQPQIDQARSATTTGIASHRDSFEVAQQKENGLLSNYLGGPIIGTMIGEAIGNSANDEEKVEKDDFPIQLSKPDGINNAILAAIAAVVEVIGNIIGKTKEQEEASKEKKSSTPKIRQDDDD